MNTPRPSDAKALEIFRAGTFTDQNGSTATFTEADLLEMAESYNPETHRAPLKRGHGSPDDAALGWAGKLMVAGKRLLAIPAQVSEALKAEVKDGQRPGISIELYPRDHAANPTPGKLHLKAIALMGAHPPSVKDLAVPAFGALEPGVLRFGAWDDRVNAGLWRNFRDWFIGKFGLEEADKVIPSWDVDALQRAAVEEQAAEAIPQPSFSEPTVTPEQKAALEAENNALKARLAKIESDRLSVEKATAHADHQSFAESLVQSGRIAGKDKDQVVWMLDSLPQVDGKLLRFGEGDAAPTMADVLKGMLSSARPAFLFGEFATHGAAGSADPKNPLVADAEARAAQANK